MIPERCGAILVVPCIVLKALGTSHTLGSLLFTDSVPSTCSPWEGPLSLWISPLQRFDMTMVSMSLSPVNLDPARIRSILLDLIASPRGHEGERVPARVDTAVLLRVEGAQALPSPMFSDLRTNRARRAGRAGAKSGCATVGSPAPCLTHYRSYPFILTNRQYGSTSVLL